MRWWRRWHGSEHVFNRKFGLYMPHGRRESKMGWEVGRVKSVRRGKSEVGGKQLWVGWEHSFRQQSGVFM